MADFSQDCAELVATLVAPLVDDREAVSVEGSWSDDNTVLVEVSVASDDIGKVIGRQGRVIKAIRTLARAAGSRQDAMVEVEVLD